MIHTDRTGGRTLMVLLAGLVLWSAAVADTESAPAWFMLEFAESKPPCADVPPGARCVGTRPRIRTFEMRDGERIEAAGGTDLPPAWAALDQMWVWVPAAAGGYQRRVIELAATPSGARLLIEDGDRQYLQSVPLDRWTALDGEGQPELWVRVTPYRP